MVQPCQFQGIFGLTRKMRSHLLAESLGPASQTATRGLSGHRMVKNVNSTAKFLVPADHGPQAHHLKLPSFISSSVTWGSTTTLGVKRMNTKQRAGPSPQLRVVQWARAAGMITNTNTRSSSRIYQTRYTSFLTILGPHHPWDTEKHLTE